jgi:hypothetical protein
MADYFNSLYGYDLGQNAAQPTALSGNISALPAIGQVAGGVNAINLGYQSGAIPNYTGLTSNVSAAAANLLDPANAQANYDVSMQGAESAVGRGIAGSGAAAETTGRLRQADIERRAMEGNALLSSQVQRLPTPFNPATQLLTPGQLSAQDAQLLETLIRRGPTGGGGGGPRGTPGLSYPGLRGGGSAAPAPGGPVGAPAPYTPVPLSMAGTGGGQSIGMLPDEWASYTDEEKSAWMQQQGTVPQGTDYSAMPGYTPDPYGGSVPQDLSMTDEAALAGTGVYGD